MKNPIKTLARLLTRNPNNQVLSSLYSAMAQPLFVHPHLGQMQMRSYLDAISMDIKPMDPKSLAGDDSQIGQYSTRFDNVGIIDIAGALVSHHMNVPCQESPVAYDAIKHDMSLMLEDPTIDTIIGRFDSPGGAASQNMDLSDFIYGSRGQGTKLIAQVDDMAYSAAFGIASAFDEIRLTRTSGVGSVGVVSYHVDQSDFNAKNGIKVEYIYAGDKKVLGNPHEPLSEEGRAEYQSEVTRLYEIFTATVARNLNMSIDAVKATEAGTFHGQSAIDAGFAHTLGTFDELIANLTTTQQVESAVEQSADTPEVDAVDDTPEVNVVDDTPEVDAVEDTLEIEQEVTIDQPDQRIGAGSGDISDEDDIDSKSDQQDAEVAAQARQSAIRAMCVAANAVDAVDDFTSSQMTVEEVRSALMDLTNAPESSIVASTSLATAVNRETIKSGWAEAFKKVK